MTIKMKIYEFDTVEELLQYEKTSIVEDKVKVVELDKPIKKEKKFTRQGKGTKWTPKEEKQFLEILKGCKAKGLRSGKALIFASKELGRTFSTLSWKKSNMGVDYKGLIPEENKIIIRKGSGKWSKEEDNYVISEVKQFCDAGRRIPKKVYKKLHKALKRKPNSIKTRILNLKSDGRLNKVIPKERRIRMTEKMIIKRRSYMLKQKPTVPLKEKFYGVIKSYKPLFSALLTEQQNNLLKSIVDNDIKVRGMSKVNEEKLKYIVDFKTQDYPQFLIDIFNNSARIKRELKIAIVNIQGEGQDRFLIFS